MSAPQIAFIVLVALELGITLGKHGEPKTGAAANYNFWLTLFGLGIVVAIVSWGGFWR